MVWISIMLCAALFFSLNHICKKKVLEDADVLDMMVVNGCLGFIMVLPMIVFVDLNISSRNLFLIAMNALLAYAGSYFLNIAYKNCEISTVSPLLNINPLLVILISYFVLGEVLNISQFSGVILILIGGYIITLKDIRRFFHPFTAMPGKYFLCVLATLVMWGICPVVNRVVLLEYDNVLSYMFLFVLFIFIIQIIVAAVTNRIKTVITLARKRWALLVLTSFFWIVSDLLHLKAIGIPAAVVSLIMPVKRISNLFTVILGGNLFREKNLVVKTTACGIMLTGLFIIGLFL